MEQNAKDKLLIDILSKLSAMTATESDQFMQDLSDKAQKMANKEGFDLDVSDPVATADDDLIVICTKSNFAEVWNTIRSQKKRG